MGDSKTLGLFSSVGTNGYQDELAANLEALGTLGTVGFTGSYAQSGQTTSGAASGVAAFIALQRFDPAWILVNLGTNDLPGIRAGTITESSWSTSMGTLLDTLHARWPVAQVLLAKVYRSDYSSEADTLNDTYIPAALASRSGWAAIGIDERGFLPGNVSDTTHPTPTGYSLTAGEWQTAMGY